MACPKCGRMWLKVEGNKLLCECGYVEEVKLDQKTIKKAEKKTQE